MRSQNRSMKSNFFFGGIGIDFSAQNFQTIENVERLPPVCTLKSHVFPKMCNAFLTRFFIPAAGIKHKSTMGNAGITHLSVYHPESVREGKLLIICVLRFFTQKNLGNDCAKIQS